MEITIDTLKTYLEKEKKDLLKSLDRDYSWTTPEKLIKERISHNFGVIMFMCEYSDIDFKDLDKLWDEYHDIYRALLIGYTKDLNRLWKEYHDILDH